MTPSVDERDLLVRVRRLSEMFTYNMQGQEHKAGTMVAGYLRASMYCTRTNYVLSLATRGSKYTSNKATHCLGHRRS